MIADMVARAIWKGAVSFRLLNIPIEVFSASSFHFIIQAAGVNTDTRPAKDRVSMKDHSSDYTPPQNNGGVTCNIKKLTDIIVELINFLGGKNVRRI